jgi:predicted metal-dependent HD superfamily phosphohydrolase
MTNYSLNSSGKQTTFNQELTQLHRNWIRLASRFSQDKEYLESVWNQLFKQYSSKNRYYHGLKHIWSMLKQSEDCKDELSDKEEVDFAIWFHDIIYTAIQKNNEEKSAEFAVRTLKQTSLHKKRIEKVSRLIVSTKKHQILETSNSDNAYLLDFDLSILGQPWEVYESYIKSIRKEYKMYPNFLYKPGRRKVLKSFLERKTLFFTEKYLDLYESQARRNLEKEIQLLS